MRLSLARSGGFGGLSQRFVADEAGLAPEERDELRRLVAGADPSTLPAGLAGRHGSGGAGPAAPAPDRFTYRLTIEDGGRRRELRFSEAAMPEALAALVRWLEARG
jgi:hypothetical protein